MSRFKCVGEYIAKESHGANKGGKQCSGLKSTCAHVNI